MERTDYEQQEVSVWNKNIEPPLLIQMFYDFIIDEENRIRKRNHEKKFQKRDLYKEISENINLSEDIVKRCQGIKKIFPKVLIKLEIGAHKNNLSSLLMI